MTEIATELERATTKERRLLLSKVDDPRTLPQWCGFCGKHESEVFCLVAGPIANICEDCIECAALVVSNKRTGQTA